MAENSSVYCKDVPYLQNIEMGMLIFSSTKWYAAFLKVSEKVDILLISFNSKLLVEKFRKVVFSEYSK